MKIHGKILFSEIVGVSSNKLWKWYLLCKSWCDVKQQEIKELEN